MKNKIKEYIDKLFKKRLKDAVNNEFKQYDTGTDEVIDAKSMKRRKDEIRKEIKEKMADEYNYSFWLTKVLSQHITNSYFPSNHVEKDLFKLLILEVSYKRTFKSACDDGHPIITELLEDLNMDEDAINICIEKAKLHNPEPLSFYALFHEELEDGNFCLDNICVMVDKLAEDSKHGAIVSHPAKMTNPACRFPKVLAFSKPSLDGFVRTGNSDVDFDIHINAVNLKVFKFLSLKYKQKTLLEYVKKDDIRIFMELFEVSEGRASKWIKSFTTCINNQDIRTNQFIRQVYFPVEDKYHSLSLLTPSGIVFSIKEKIDAINDRSPNVYVGKKRKMDNKYYEDKFSTIPNLTVTRHGGDHPKNISGLNNKYQFYYLLHSSPPALQKRNIYFPKRNFFGESFRYYECRDIFAALHKLFKTDYNNKRIREGRDYRLHDVMARIVDKMWAVRGVAEEQYRPDDSSLKPHQRTWLCPECRQNREEDDAWLDKLCKEISAWIIHAYEKLLGKQALKLDESIWRHIYKIVSENREALR